MVLSTYTATSTSTSTPTGSRGGRLGVRPIKTSQLAFVLLLLLVNFLFFNLAILVILVIILVLVIIAPRRSRVAQSPWARGRRLTRMEKPPLILGLPRQSCCLAAAVRSASPLVLSSYPPPKGSFSVTSTEEPEAAKKVLLAPG
jgi:hypothetical protein